MNMMARRMRMAVLTAAVAAIPLVGFTSDAAAQYRVNADGRALDANPRIGSGGTNTQTGVNNTVNGNDIVTGNVSGGKGFRGDVPYRSARDFRGAAPGGTSMDDFIKRSSSAADTETIGSPYRVTSFYGSARTVDPPPGFQPAALGTGAFVPPPTGIVNRSLTGISGDSRIGATELGQPGMSDLPTPGQLLLPGPVDPTAGQQYISATPLTGIRQVGANDVGTTGTLTNTQYNPSNGRLTAQQIQQMRDELNTASQNEPLAPQPQPQQQQQQPGNTNGGPNNNGNNGNNGSNNGAAGSGAGNTGATRIQGAEAITGASPVNPIAGAQPVNTAIAPTMGGSTDQSTRLRLLAPPQQQSGLYAQLLKRHEESVANQNVSDEQAARDFNAVQRAQQQAQQAAKGQPGAPGAPGAGGAGGAQAGGAGAAQAGGTGGAGAAGQPGGVSAIPVPPPAAGGAGTGATPNAAPGVPNYAQQNEQIFRNLRNQNSKLQPLKKPEPVKVPSLATGMKSKGLADVMRNAETFMKDGKFTAALEQYDQAEQVAPNNPLIRLGRANAELGASYYARADAHLREAFGASPALLAGQYDLTALLGEQRLRTLVGDLKELAAKDQREARPLFLLSYIAYNTGHEQQASAYLDLANKRAGERDPFYKLLRDNWSLPTAPGNAGGAGGGAGATTTPAAPDLNK